MLVTGSLKAAFSIRAITAPTAYVFKIGSHFNGLDVEINFGGIWREWTIAATRPASRTVVPSIFFSGLQVVVLTHGFL